MCGIFGYIRYLAKTGQRDVIKAVLSGLHNLLYRGQDSVGISFDDLVDGERKIVIGRSLGSTEEIINVLHDYLTRENQHELDTHVCIGHTRWATHGEPKVKNAHPQESSTKCEFVVVHNGSIDNYADFRAFLEDEGFVRPPRVRKVSSISGDGAKETGGSGIVQIQSDKPHDPPYSISSETDTEMLAKFCFYISTQMPGAPFPVIVANCTRFIQGSAAMIIKSAMFPDESVAFRLSSPLVLGFKYNNPNFHREFRAKNITEVSLTDFEKFDGVQSFSLSEDGLIPVPDEVFISSDAQSFSQYTSEVLYLHDYDLIHFTKNGICIYNIGNDADTVRTIVHIDKPEEFDIPVEDHTRNTFSEIMQQPVVLQRLCDRMTNYETGVITVPGIEPHLSRIRNSRRLIFVGSGSSYNAVLASRTTLEDLLSQVIQFEFSCEYTERDVRVTENDVCVFVSQSGETADTLLALHHCKAMGAFCIGITNTRGSSLTRGVDFCMYTDVGVERGVASTKTYTANVVAIILFSLAVNDKLGIPIRKTIIDGLRNIGDTLQKAFAHTKLLERIADNLKDQTNMIVCGRGGNYAVARETTMKLKTLAYMNAESFHGGELKHGPIALVQDGQKIIFLATVPTGLHIEMYRSILGQIAARGGFPIVLADSTHADVLDYFADEIIILPHVIDCLQPVINVIPMQLLAYYIAEKKGLNVDRPRNLAKCATIQ